MILIESYTDIPIHNIAACLRLRPETLVFAGDAEKIRNQQEKYEKIFRQRGLRTRIISYDTRNKDFDQLRAALDRLLHTDDSCVIDLTGGEEPVIMAVGGALACLAPEKRKQVQVQKLDLSSQTVRDCINDNKILPGRKVCLSIEDLFFLHGGLLYSSNHQPPASFSAAKLDKLWQIAADRPKDWNKAISYLNEFESRADSKTQVYLPLSSMGCSISDFAEKEPTVRQLLEQFHRSGIINLHCTDRGVEYAFTDPIYRYCTLKAGNILEVKTLLEARELLDNGAPFFNDCRMGVSIDWDGKTNDRALRIPETRNEIDVVLMHGIAPLFVSCKNGTIGEDELYKLHTVATRFAGPHARKMLIATELAKKTEAADRSFAQRAKDMGILLIPNAAKLTKQQWRDAFRDAMQ